MPLIKCPDCGKEFSDAAVVCPNCGRPQRPVAAPKRGIGLSGCAGVGCLVLLIVTAIGVIGSVGDSASSGFTSSSGGVSAPAPAPSEPQLELVSWNWHTEYDYAIAEGRVKNISTQRLENVMAVVTYTDRSGGFITSDEALISLNPILPGQTSSFRVTTTENPAMRKASIDFRQLMGGAINWRQRASTGK